MNFKFSAAAPAPGDKAGKDSDSESFGATGTGSPQDPAAALSRKPDNEEPAMVLEPDLPSDGRDEVGEAMISNLPPRPELSELLQTDATRSQP